MRFFKRLRRTIGINGIKVLVLVIIFTLTLIFINLTGAFFWTLFFTFIFFKIDSKYTGQAALVCLIILPILLALGKQDVAEQVAVYAFFLLTITVALQIIELKSTDKETRKLEFIDKPVHQVSEVTKRVSRTLDLRMKRAVLDLRHHK